MSLGYSLHLVNSHLPAISNTLAEQLVAAAYRCSEIAYLLVVHRTRGRSEEAVPVGLHSIKFQAELLRQQLAIVRNDTEDAYTARQRSRLCEYIVCIAAHVVATRGSLATHGDNNRLLLTEQLHLMPYLLRRIRRATTGVHPYDDSLHVIILGQLLQVTAHVSAHNGSRI